MTGLSKMEQLLAFCDWERKHRRPEYGSSHIAEWAAEEIERLGLALAAAQEEIRRLQRQIDGANAADRSMSEALNSGDGAYRP